MNRKQVKIAIDAMAEALYAVSTKKSSNLNNKICLFCGGPC